MTCESIYLSNFSQLGKSNMVKTCESWIPPSPNLDKVIRSFKKLNMLQGLIIQPRTIHFLLCLLFDLSYRCLLFASATNLELGPRFARIWKVAKRVVVLATKPSRYCYLRIWVIVLSGKSLCLCILQTKGLVDLKKWEIFLFCEATANSTIDKQLHKYYHSLPPL